MMIGRIDGENLPRISCNTSVPDIPGIITSSNTQSKYAGQPDVAPRRRNRFDDLEPRR